MTDQPADDPLRVDLLTGPVARDVLAAVLDAVGAALHDSRVRSVHRRGTSSAAVVHEVALTTAGGERRDRLYVTHTSTRRVPGGAAKVEVEGTPIHVWQFPHDPYLPGLPSAVNLAQAAALLRRTTAHADVDRPGVRTRSYRPTRRAVVELRPATGAPPAAFVKLLGGRHPDRVEDRTRDLVAAHAAFTAAGLPVPHVLSSDEELGRVVLEAVSGATLRTALRAGDAVPDARSLRDLLARTHEVDLDDGGDPDGFADVTRHLRVLRERLPHRAADLARLGAVAGSVGGPRATLHGDLHDGQVLVEVGGAISGLLDVDGAGRGFVAHDVGRLLAHTEANELAVPARADAIAARVRALAAACGDLAPERDVAAAAAAAWVGLATGPLRVAADDWQVQCDERLDRAVAWAARSD